MTAKGKTLLVPAVALLSAGLLAYEILLVRAFAIEHFHHFAYLAVGVAMLGFGVSGTVWSVAARWARPRSASWLLWSALLTPLALVASPALIHRLPLDPTQLAWNAGQWVLLLSIEALLALPFAFGSMAILLSLETEPGRAGRIYAASLAGAGSGAAIGVASLWVLSVEQAHGCAALLASAGALSAAFAAPLRRAAIAGGAVTLVLALIVTVHPLWRLEVTPYKGLPQVEAYPGARRVAERTHPMGWVVEVEAPAFRYAPGLSLEFRGGFPRQRGIFLDGQLVGAVSAWHDSADAHAFTSHLPTALPYALGRRERILVVGAGDGLEVPSALAHGATDVTAVELHPELARRARAQASRLAHTPVRWVVGDARGYLARTKDRFDLITLGAGGAFGTSAAGLHSLDEDFLQTVDAYEAYLSRLERGGVLSVTRWLSVPLREPIRMILTACEAMRRVAPDALPHGLIVSHSWATVTVLASPTGFTPGSVDSIRSWAAACGLDVDWHPGIEGPPPPGFNALGGDALYEAARSGIAGRASAKRFASDYPFLVSAVGDSKPYAHHFLRWRSLPSLLGPERGGWLPFAEWGYVALVATLILSAALASVFTIGPLLAGRDANTAAGIVPLVAYFGAIGFAYLAAEIAAIQQMVLLLGHPVYAVAATLTALLICSGAGSAWSERLAPQRLRPATAGLAALLALYALLLLAVVSFGQSAPLAARCALAFAALAPPAFLMGVPFPVGLRALAGGDASRVAWAWAANGFASVVAAPLAALLALEWGSRALFLAAAVAYAASAMLLGPLRREPQVAARALQESKDGPIESAAIRDPRVG